VFAAAAVGAGLVRTVATTYLPVLLADIREAPGLIGLVMIVNSLAGFAVPLTVGLWSDRRHTARRGRRPFIAGGCLVTVLGLVAVTLGYQTTFLVLTLAGFVTYAGVNVVTTAHRALVHDCFDEGRRTLGNGLQEVAMLVGALLGLVVGGMLGELATWAPFLLAAVAMPLLVWPTLRGVPVGRDLDELHPEHRHRPVRFYSRVLVRPGVRTMLAAEILWVLGYAALPVFFVLYAKNVLGLGTGLASLWLAGFAVVSGIAMLGAGRLRSHRLHKPLLVVGVVAMGLGFLAIAASTELMAVSMGVLIAAIGFGMISTLGYALFAHLIPHGQAGSYTALYFSLRAAAAAVALPIAGWTIAATGSYRSMFVLAGVATLAALFPLAWAPGPRRAAIMREHVAA
jgi:MFS family permease